MKEQPEEYCDTMQDQAQNDKGGPAIELGGTELKYNCCTVLSGEGSVFTPKRNPQYISAA